MSDRNLGDPSGLSAARNMAHAAAQILYRVAVANVAPLSGHEHTNLGWRHDAQSFQTWPLNEAGLAADLTLDPLVLRLGAAELALDGVSEAEALAWLDECGADAGLKPAGTVPIRYDLPVEVTSVDRFAIVAGLPELAAWFDIADETLTAFADSLADLTPSAVRCWPHHFDIATYVALESGDPEEARGIGVGLSPGDGSYDQPYFYINPWPRLDPSSLPSAVAPGHWHVEGFVGSVATGEDILTLPDPVQTIARFLKESFQASRTIPSQ